MNQIKKSGKLFCFKDFFLFKIYNISILFKKEKTNENNNSRRR